MPACATSRRTGPRAGRRPACGRRARGRLREDRGAGGAAAAGRRNSVLLRGRLFDTFASWEQTLTEALVERDVDRATGETLAAIGLGVFRTAVARWLREPGTDLAVLVEEAFDRIAVTTRRAMLAVHAHSTNGGRTLSDDRELLQKRVDRQREKVEQASGVVSLTQARLDAASTAGRRSSGGAQAARVVREAGRQAGQAAAQGGQEGAPTGPRCSRRPGRRRGRAGRDTPQRSRSGGPSWPRRRPPSRRRRPRTRS